MRRFDAAAMSVLRAHLDALVQHHTGQRLTQMIGPTVGHGDCHGGACTFEDLGLCTGPGVDQPDLFTGQVRAALAERGLHVTVSSGPDRVTEVTGHGSDGAYANVEIGPLAITVIAQTAHQPR